MKKLTRALRSSAVKGEVADFTTPSLFTGLGEYFCKCKQKKVA